MAYKKPRIEYSNTFTIHGKNCQLEVEHCEELNMSIQEFGDNLEYIEFDTLESAEEYSRLLASAIEELKRRKK